MQWSVAVDLKRCTGCQSCTIACKLENGTPPGVFWTRVLEKEEGTFPFAYKIFIPQRCNHCAEPPCVEVCPTGASHVREQDNLVLVDQDACIGCHALRRRLSVSGPLHSRQQPRAITTNRRPTRA